jgi:hypothetical protein
MPFQAVQQRQVTIGYRLAGLSMSADFPRQVLQRLPMAQVGAPAAKFPDINTKESRVYAATQSKALQSPPRQYWQRIPLIPVGAPAAAFPALQRPRASDYAPPLSANYWQRLPITPSVVILPAVAFPPPQRWDAFYRTQLHRSHFQQVLLSLSWWWWSNPGLQPQIWSVSPTHGPRTGGDTVTILGLHFTGVTSVRFGALAAASFTVDSDTRITATTPALPSDDAAYYKVVGMSNSSPYASENGPIFTYDAPFSTATDASFHGGAGRMAFESGVRKY